MLKILPKDNNFILLQKENEKRFSKFLDILDMAICRINALCTLRARGEKISDLNHGRGSLIVALESIKKISDSFYFEWYNDYYHGIAHGLISAFFSWYFLEEKLKNKYYNEFFESNLSPNYANMSCEGAYFLLAAFLHDFFRPSSPRHDQDLMSLTAKFPQEIYYHSNPPSNYASSPLIQADKIELMRFDGYEKWADIRDIQKLYGVKEIEHFYKHIRPMISHALLNRNKIWISHGIEWTKNISETAASYTIRQLDKENSINQPFYSDYYPSWHFPNGLDPYYCVDLIKLTGEGRPRCWAGKVTGLLTKQDLNLSDGEITACPKNQCGRDHAWVKKGKQIPIEKWDFLYTSEEYLYLMKCHKMKVMYEPLFFRMIKLVDALSIYLESFII